MTESTSPEERGPGLTFEQARQLNRSLTEKVLDKAARDPQWRQLLLDDPEAAMQEANFPEIEELGQRALRRPREREVVGQSDSGGYGGYGGGSSWQCHLFNWNWNQSSH